MAKYLSHNILKSRPSSKSENSTVNIHLTNYKTFYTIFDQPYNIIFISKYSII